MLQNPHDAGVRWTHLLPDFLNPANTQPPMPLPADAAPPPPPLATAALRKYDQGGDVRWAVPVLAGAPASRAETLLPPVAATCGTGESAAAGHSLASRSADSSAGNNMHQMIF